MYIAWYAKKVLWPGLVVQACSSRYQEVDEGGSQSQGLPGRVSEILSQTRKLKRCGVQWRAPCLGCTREPLDSASGRAASEKAPVRDMVVVCVRACGRARPGLCEGQSPALEKEEGCVCVSKRIQHVNVSK